MAMTVRGTNMQRVHDNRNVAYLNGNSENRNLNVNWFENDWNDNCRFAAVRNFIRRKAVYASHLAFYRFLLLAPRVLYICRLLGL